MALVLALQDARAARRAARTSRCTDHVAAISVGIVDGVPLLDLAYEEDSRADVDMNVVKTSDGRYIEIQGTAETTPFGRDRLYELLALADAGIAELVALQKQVLG